MTPDNGKAPTRYIQLGHGQFAAMMKRTRLAPNGPTSRASPRLLSGMKRTWRAAKPIQVGTKRKPRRSGAKTECCPMSAFEGASPAGLLSLTGRAEAPFLRAALLRFRPRRNVSGGGIGRRSTQRIIYCNHGRRVSTGTPGKSEQSDYENRDA